MVTIAPREIRNVCGTFATGVTVITTQVNGEIAGMTANGFMSLSLSPFLIVVSVGNNQKMKSKIDSSRQFAVSILAHDQQLISDHFAGRPDTGFSIKFDTFNNVAVIPNAVSYFTANVKSAHEEGDHTLYVGEVSEFKYNDRQPLLFVCGKYHRL